MSRSPTRPRRRAAYLHSLLVLAGVGPAALACSFSTFGVDLPADTSSGEPEDGTSETTATTGAEPGTTDLTTDITSGSPTGSSTGEPAPDETTGAPPVDCTARSPISLADTLAAITDDIHSPAVDVVAVPYTRYLGLVHLYNAGLCDDEIEVHRIALAKLLNSLSLEPGIVMPAAIDPQRLLYRIDLRSYAWDRAASSSETKQAHPDVWELLAAADPHAVVYSGDVAAALQAATATAFPLLRADAVLRHGVTAPLYYDVLGLPLTRATLETVLDIDTAGGVAQERSGEVVGKVGRAALHQSGVAQLHRVVERHAFPKVSGAYWIAHDFLTLGPTTDVFTAPFDWQADELSVSFNLPNGLLGHVIFDGDGGRRITARKELLHDPHLPDGIVRAGISCIGCHTDGIQPAEDDLRHALDEDGGDQFDAATQEQIRRLYPPRAELSQHIDLDTQRFTSALAAMAVPPGLTQEPVLAAYLEYDRAIDLRRAAAELWLTEQDPDALRDIVATLGGLEALTAADATISRDVMTTAFAAAICTLGLGRTSACPDA